LLILATLGAARLRAGLDGFQQSGHPIAVQMSALKPRFMMPALVQIVAGDRRDLLTGTLLD
jgi:hypothetical protein